MKKYILLIVITVYICNPQFIYAQVNRCASYSLRATEEKLHPVYAVNRASFENAYRNWNKPGLKQNDSIFIPLAIHIVWHNNEENISDAQIQSQIDVLNSDFNSLNADTINTPGYFKERHGKTNFYFRLAKQTPDGLPTTGINRVYTNNDSGFAFDDKVQYSLRGGDDPWDPAHYVNIWICKFSVNTFAYTYFPGGSLYKEGIICDYHYFGTTRNIKPPYNLGRTVTHEMGHYFNLDHIWGPTDVTSLADCADDDHVYDTPLQSVANYGCPGFPHKSCIQDSSDAYMDYMDYTDDPCMNLFTKGQADRMLASYYIMTPDLQYSKALNEPSVTNNDAGVKEILAPVDNSYSCLSNIYPRIVLRNYGGKTLDSVTLQYGIKGQPLTSLKITGLNMPAYSLDTFRLSPLAVAGKGSLGFIAYTEKPNGFTDENPVNNSKAVIFNFNGAASVKLPFSENFSNNFPPKGWSIYNPDHFFTWAPTSGSLLSGFAPSIMMDNIEYEDKNETDDLIMPPFNLKNTDNPVLVFDHAFALYKYGRQKSDTLKIKISANCGNTWQTVYYKGGLDLSTAANNKYGYFSPDSTGQWKRDTIELGTFKQSNNVLIAFENINGNDNLIYIDNIEVKDLKAEAIFQFARDNVKLPGNNNIIITPNPVKNDFRISGIALQPGCTIRCFDIAGKCVWQKAADIYGQSLFTLPFSIANGSYILSIREQNKTYVKKIIVSH
ncbi:MAG TPA: M43 family zinc metalloprotease [Panacibacter sp.]|nr:M43 family zinc metalloprotease [Panacibacter sp.]